MAIDQRDVSSTLRFMDDRALQQYAAMHKNDPYIFPLAFQESQNRQRLRMQQQTAQAMQPQPKVTEQALAQMSAQPMPEEQGIGALPVGNMQQMADGGIAGYDDDANFAQRSEPVVMMAGGGVARYQIGGETMGGFGGLSPEQTAALELKAENEKRLQQLTDLEKQVAFLTSVGAPQAQQARAQLDALKSTMGPKPSPTDTSFRRQEDPRMKPGVAATARPLITSDAAPKVDTIRRNTAATEAATKEPATTDVMGMFDQALKKADEKPNPLEAQLKAINAEKVKAGEENVAGIEAIQKQFSNIFQGKKDRLDTREREIGKMKDQSLGLALLQAGASIMSTRGSIGQALGAGIDTGSKQYVAGLDKINTAKEKLSDARDRLDELEAQRGELSARELHKARNEVKTLTIAGMENLVQAAMAERKMNRAEAVAFVEQQIKVAEAAKNRASQEGIARLQAQTANRTPAEIQMVERIMKEKNIPFSEALASLTATKREPVSIEKLRGDWLDMAKRAQIQADYPNIKSFDDYLTVFGGGAGGGGGGDFKLVGVRPAK